jgi:neuronal calcium sensor 1
MGNQIGKGANRMAIAAMSNVTHIEKRELAGLQSKLREIASREGNPSTVNRTEFTEALNIIGINQNDADILDKLFTMFDKTGDDVINYRDFIVGIAPLISGTPNEKLDFAFRLYDLEGSGNIKANEMIHVLSNINRVASSVFPLSPFPLLTFSALAFCRYFGDPVMSEDQIQNLVNF